MFQVNPQTFSLIVDFETTGLDTTTARPIEMGLQLVDSDTWDIKAEGNYLLWDTSYPPIPAEITKITGITEEVLRREGRSLDYAFADFTARTMHLNDWAIDETIAYNAEYDENIFRAECARKKHSSALEAELLDQASWLCAMKDVEENYKFKCWKLSHLALDHGVSIDPKGLHRALADVDLTRRMLKEIGTTALKMAEFKRIPHVTVQALIPAPFEDGGKGRDLAVARGYSWERPRGSQEKFPKAWVKKVKQNKYNDEVAECPFKIRMLQP